jgi:hypothetical protein
MNGHLQQRKGMVSASAMPSIAALLLHIRLQIDLHYM